jgi:hypothetical protein
MKPLFACVSAVCAVLAGCGGQPERADVLDVRPRDFSTPAWDEALGGDSAFDPAKLDGLSDLGPDATSAMAVARDVVIADTTGVGRDTYAAYFADTPAAGCSDVVVTATSAFLIGEIAGVRYAKALVAWTGSCAVAV